MKAKVFLSMCFFACTLQAAPPEGRDDLYLTSVDTSLRCFVLLNDQDPDGGDNLSVDSFDATSTEGGTITDNGDGTLQYSPATVFSGLDTFDYTVTDGNAGYDTATVRINVNTPFDTEAARDDILNGVTTLGDPGGPGWMVVYGKTAYSIGNYNGNDHREPMVAAGALGQGRILAMPDHQWLNMDSQGSSGDAGQFYLNSIAWLAGTTSKSIKIVVTTHTSATTWLTDPAQGFTNVVQSSNYATELPSAHVLIGWLGSSVSQSDIDIIADFVRNGGGLFICDYGIGYSWWWGKTLPNAPGNLLLRHAGIGFTGEWPGGSLTVDRATGQTTSEDVIDMLTDSSGYNSTELDIGAKVLDRMFQVLQEGDSLLARLDEKFYERIGTINPTPTTPVSDSFEKALLRRESTILANTPVDEVIEHRTAEAVYGTIPGGAPRITRTLSFNATQEGRDTRNNDSDIWLSTGLYAVPGEIVTITVPPTVTTLGLKVKINGDWNNVSGRSSYLRMPFGTSRDFSLDQTSVDTANAFGGLLWVVVPTNTVPGAFDVTFGNVIEAPYFIMGQDTNTDWINTLRNKPAPWAELVSENMIITLPKYMVEDLDQAEELMTFWNNGVAAQDDLGNWMGNRTRPMRMYSMIQTAWGSGYAGYPIGGWGWDYGDYTAKEAGSCWGEFHETGHWHQSGYWTDGRTGEVTVNVFTMRAIEAVCDSGKASGGWGNQWIAAERVLKYQSAAGKGGFDEADLGERLVMYSQLKTVFGWDAFKNTFQTYLDDEQSNPSALPTTDQEEWDQWMTRLSREVGYDLSPFFVDWDYGVSQAAIDSLSHLPEWNMAETVDDLATTVEDIPVVIGNFLDNDFSFDGILSFAGIGNPSHGTVTDNGNGTYTYTPDIGFTGEDTIAYAVENGFGNTFTGTIKVTVIRTDGLAYHWRLDETTGPTAVEETRRHDGTYIGSPAFGQPGASAGLGTAVFFDGVDDAIEIPALNLYSNTVTITAWVKRNGEQSAFGGIVFSRSGSTVAGLNFGNANELRYHWNDASNTWGWDSGLVVPNNQWTFVGLAVQPDRATIYMNDQGATNTVTHAIEEFDGTTRIAMDFAGRLLNGWVDDVRIYYRALSPSEIGGIFNESDTTAPTPDPATWQVPPHATGHASISMTATMASDTAGVEYYFACTSGGGHDRGWQNSHIYEDTALEPSRWYTYVVTARDKSHNYNKTIPSQGISVRTFGTGDFEPDGDVDFDDYARFASHWLDTDTLVERLFAHWKLDGDANDPVGGNHGTVYGNPVWTAGQLDGALNFDGDGDYIDCGNDSSLNLTNNFSIAAWFNPDDAGPVVLICICKGNVPAYQSAGAYTILCVPSNGTLSFYVRNSSNTDFEYATTTITLNEWTHVVGTFSDGNIIVYKNGSFAADGDLGTLPIHSNNESLGIGAEGDGGMPFEGRIDDVRIYDRVLSEAEAEELTELLMPDPYNADLDGDNDVDLRDLAVLAGNWLGNVEQPPVPLPGQTSNPVPADGATNVSTTEDLSWTAGFGALARTVHRHLYATRLLQHSILLEQ
ncbi:MAG: M60 family metallopeptidase [Planctomycetota bacterium]|jgi:hypothetical protein